MVAGQPVAVQSPARKKRGQTVAASGRYSSDIGRAEYVALISLITVDFSTFASAIAGKNSCSSASAKSRISCFDLSTSDFEELTTSSRYDPVSCFACNRLLLNIHWMVRSSKTACGKSVTSLSNQKWMPVMGEV